MHKLKSSLWLAVFTSSELFGISFGDVTQGAGINHTHSHEIDAGFDTGIIYEIPVQEYLWMTGGAVAEDFNGDGWIDLFVLQGGSVSNVLYINNTDGTFSDQTLPAGIHDPDLHMGVTAGDFDSDGDVDIFSTVINVGIDQFNRQSIISADVQLLENDGAGVFSEFTISSSTSQRFLTGPSLGDLDNDGDLDLVVGEWGQTSETRLDIWHNHDGNFVLVQSLPHKWVFHSKFADIDNDGDQDLLAVADFGETAIYLNNGSGVFSFSTKMDVENGMGSALGDIDNDGDLDWFVSSIRDFDGSEANWGTSGNRMYINDGYGNFYDGTDGAGVRDGYWGWGSVFSDLDNDGDLDLYQTNGWPDNRFKAPVEFAQTPDLVFENVGNGSFQSISDESIGITRNIGAGRCVVAFDYDNDGDQDLYIENNSFFDDNGGSYTYLPGQPLLLRNEAANDDSWLKVSLLGSDKYHSHGIGSRVYVTANDQVQLREINASSGYNGHGPNRLAHFGLGSANIINELKVVWPGGLQTILQNVTTNQKIDISSPISSLNKSNVSTDEAILAVADTSQLPAGWSIEWVINGVSYYDDNLELSFSEIGDYSIKLNVYSNEGAQTLQYAEVLTITVADLPNSTHSIARIWNEQILDAIRIDFPDPTVHARNLYHLSVAMWDVWAAYSENAVGYLTNYPTSYVANDNDIDEAISYAAYRILSERYAGSVNGSTTLALIRSQMLQLGYNPDLSVTVGDSPAALGNRIATTVLDYFTSDGSEDTTTFLGGEYTPSNQPLAIADIGTAMLYPNLWQPLLFEVAFTQNEQTADLIQDFLGENWGLVRPFSLYKNINTNLYFDPGSPPYLGGVGDAEYKSGSLEVISKSNMLDPDLNQFIDISPAVIGNSSLGTDDGSGYALNPVTGLPYLPNVVNRADFGRVVAEFWADGPNSETPPGHWNKLANEVVDNALFVRKIGGDGPLLSPLEWDVKMYFALNGALHDAAIAAWGCKRVYDYVRPISSIRYMAGLGQSSDPMGASYHESGLPLINGLVEVITSDSVSFGQRHQHLSEHVGKIAIKTWHYRDGVDPNLDHHGIDWILGEAWLPYQRDTFVTPAFPGYVSGHSTFSRAAAEVLTKMTGTPYFPGGIGEFTAHAGEYLEFEYGPTTDVVLQWATYFDAADQAGLSRIYGGIHVPVDDYAGRIIGSQCGQSAWDLAKQYFDGSILGHEVKASLDFDGDDLLLTWTALRGFYYKIEDSVDLKSFSDVESWFRAEDGIIQKDYLFPNPRPENYFMKVNQHHYIPQN